MRSNGRVTGDIRFLLLVSAVGIPSTCLTLSLQSENKVSSLLWKEWLEPRLGSSTNRRTLTRSPPTIVMHSLQSEKSVKSTLE